MRDLIIKSLAGMTDPVSVSSLQQREPFRSEPEEFERQLQTLVREGSLVRVKVRESVEEKVVLAECLPSPKDQILRALQTATLKGGNNPTPLDSIVEVIIGFSEDTARAALQGLIQDGMVTVGKSSDGQDVACLANHIMPVQVSSENIPKRLVEALRRLRNGPQYPVRLEELLQAAGTDGLEASQAKKAGKRGDPKIFFKTDPRGWTLAAFGEDIEQLVDLAAPLIKLRDSGDPKKYPVSLTSLMELVESPEQGKGVLKDRLISAEDRPIAGVSVKGIRLGKRIVRKYTLREDEELLDMLSLNKDALQQRILGLWMELKGLRAFRRAADAVSPKHMGHTEPEGHLTVDQRERARGKQALGILASTPEMLEEVWRVIQVASARNKFAWVRISDLRKQFKALSRRTMNEILTALSRDRRINLMPLNDRSVLSQGESDQLLSLSGTLYYAVSVRQEV